MIKKILKPFLSFAKRIIFLKIQSIKIQPPQKIIHIVRTDAFGDFVLFSQILPYFRKIYPGYKIVLIGNALWQELAMWVEKEKVLMDSPDSYFDELLPIEEKKYNRNLFYYYKTLKKIRLFSPEIVVQPTFSRTPKGDDIVFISKEAFKVGYDGDLSNIKERQKSINDKKYNRLINNPDSALETEKNKHFLNELTNHKFILPGGPQWKLRDKLLSESRDFLKSIGLDLSRPIIVICADAGHSIRCWPADNFASLILKLFRYGPSFQFILTGGARGMQVYNQIKKEKGVENISLYNLCGKIKLSELAKTLAVSDLYIGNETGPMHLALAVGASTISLVGGGHYSRYSIWKTGPKNIAFIHKMDCFDCNWKCIYRVKKGDAMPCLKNIKTDDIYSQAIKFLPK